MTLPEGLIHVPGFLTEAEEARTVWGYGEYAGSGNSWRTRVTATRF
jgi:hypothetical protein